MGWEKRTFLRRSIALLCSLAMMLSLLVGVAAPTYASNLGNQPLDGVQGQIQAADVGDEVEAQVKTQAKTYAKTQITQTKMEVKTQAKALSDTASSATDDLKGHWAEEAMRQWVDRKLLTGYGDGKFLPDRDVTRGEIMALINRAFQLPAGGEASFSDLDAKEWVYQEVATAIAAGYVQGYDDQTIRWRNAVTRGQAAVMLESLLKLGGADERVLSKFVDFATIAQWNRGSLAAVQAAGLLGGYPDGTIRPSAALTRAQAVTLLQRALEYKEALNEENGGPAEVVTTVYDKAGEYGPASGVEAIAGNVVIGAAGITLRNVNIEGNLLLDSAIGEGEAYFEHVTVKGTTTIQGGGEHSIYFANSAIGKLIVSKKNGAVRVAISGSTTVEHTTVQSAVILEGEAGGEGGFGNVELAKALASGTKVLLSGKVQKLLINAAGVVVTVQGGFIGEASVAAGSTDVQFDLDTDSEVGKLVLNAPAKVTGKGEIKEAVIGASARESSFESEPTKKSGPGTVDETDSGAPGAGSGGNGGGGGGGFFPPVNPPVKGEPQLASLTVGQLPLLQVSTGKTGFDPAIIHHRVVTAAHNGNTAQVKYTLKDADSLVYEAYSWPGNLAIASGEVQGNGTISLALPVKQDTYVLLQAVSGTGNNKKTTTYFLEIMYPLQLQDGLKISRERVGNVYNYYLGLSNIQGKDQVSNELKLRVSNEQGQLFTCAVGDCRIPPYADPMGSGVWAVEVLENEQVIASGDYAFDLDELQPESGFPFEYEQLDREEIREFNTYWDDEFAYFGLLDIKLANAPVKFRDAAYISVLEENITVPQSTVPAWGRELFKPGVGLTLSELMPLEEGRAVLLIGERWSELDGNTVHDQLLYIALYDSQMRFLGYYVQPLIYNDNVLSEGLVASNLWDPTGGHGDGLLGAATLDELEIEGYTLIQAETGIEGFDPNVKVYNVAVNRDVEEVLIRFQTSNAYRTFYGVSGDNVEQQEQGMLSGDASEVNVKLLPKQTTRLTLGPSNDKSSASYTIMFNYPNNVQEGFSVSRIRAGHEYIYQLGFRNLAGINYYSVNWLGRTSMTVHSSADSDEILMSCQGNYCDIPREMATNAATWYIRAYADDVLIAEGEYVHTFTVVEPLFIHSGITVEKYTRAQLDDPTEEICGWCGENETFSYGFKVFGDREVLRQTGASYVAFATEVVKVNQSTVPQWSAELLSANHNYLHSLKFQPGQETSLYGSYGHRYFWENKEVHDQLLYTIFYDDELNVIGYYTQAIQFDVNTVGTGYTPTNLWKPGQGFGDGLGTVVVPPVNPPVNPPGTPEICIGDDCDYVRINSIQAGDYVLKKRLPFPSEFQTGFVNGYTEYLVTLPPGMVGQQTLPITFNFADDQFDITVKAINKKTGEIVSRTPEIIEGQAVFNLDVDANSSYRLLASIHDRTSKAYASYTIDVEAFGEIEDGLVLRRSKSPSTHSYELLSLPLYWYSNTTIDYFSPLIEVYAVEGGGPSAEEPLFTCYGLCYLDADFLAQGDYYIKLLHNGQILREGLYRPDLQPVYANKEDVGLAAAALTVEELVSEANKLGYPELSYGIYVSANVGKLNEAFPEARYFAASTEDVTELSGSYWDWIEQGVLSSQNMINNNQHIFSLSLPGSGTYPIYSTFGFTMLGGGKTIHDKLIYLSFYDAGYQLVGYVVLPVKFTTGETLAEGYTASGYWQPK